MFYETGPRASERIGSLLRDIAFYSFLLGCLASSLYTDTQTASFFYSLAQIYRWSYSNTVALQDFGRYCIGERVPASLPLFESFDLRRTLHWSAVLLPFRVWWVLSGIFAVDCMPGTPGFCWKVTNSLITPLSKLDLRAREAPASNIHCQSGLLFFCEAATPDFPRRALGRRNRLFWLRSSFEYGFGGCRSELFIPWRARLPNDARVCLFPADGFSRYATNQ